MEKLNWVQVRQRCDHVLDVAQGDLHVYDASFSTHNSLKRYYYFPYFKDVKAWI